MSKAKVFAIMNEKGGVGKTTTATNMAYLLGKQNKKVLLIDFDGQANTTMLMFNENPNSIGVTISTILNNIINSDYILPYYDYVIKSKLILYTISKIYGKATGIEKIHIDDIIKLCKNNIGNKYLTPKKGLKIYVKKGKIFFIA